MRVDDKIFYTYRIFKLVDNDANGRSDAAIAKLPADVVASLTADPTGALANVLLYHVVSGVAKAGNLSDGLQFSTLLGANLTVSINANGVFINDSQVTVADIHTDNGVVHVIDTVLVP